MEIFPRFAVGFRWNDQDASRARIFSWSGIQYNDHDQIHLIIIRKGNIALICLINCFSPVYKNQIFVLMIMLTPGSYFLSGDYNRILCREGFKNPFL